MTNQDIEIGRRLMLITHRTGRYTEYDEAEMFLQGGGRWVQLRMKQGLDPVMADRIAALCRTYGAVFCIDDDVSLALSIWVKMTCLSDKQRSGQMPRTWVRS